MNYWNFNCGLVISTHVYSVCAGLKALDYMKAARCHFYQPSSTLLPTPKCKQMSD